MAQEDSDKQLVEQALDGHVEAFNLLVWRCQRHLYNFLLRLTGDRTHAEDLCQETFLRGYLHLKELRDRERFRSWLFRIAVNLYRSDRRRLSPLAADAPESESLDGPVSHSPSMPRETQLAIRTLILRLRPELREVILLHFFHGFHFDEMAEILDCPVSTLKSRLYKAVDELRTGLQRQN